MFVHPHKINKHHSQKMLNSTLLTCKVFTCALDTLLAKSYTHLYHTSLSLLRRNVLWLRSHTPLCNCYIFQKELRNTTLQVMKLRCKIQMQCRTHSLNKVSVLNTWEDTIKTEKHTSAAKRIQFSYIRKQTFKMIK